MTIPAGCDRALAVGYNRGMPDLPPRRRFQFRLRTMMIGVTIFCVVGGWLGANYLSPVNDWTR